MPLICYMAVIECTECAFKDNLLMCHVRIINLDISSAAYWLFAVAHYFEKCVDELKNQYLSLVYRMSQLVEFQTQN